MRVHERLDELYAIGGGRGANRVGGSEGEDRAHELAAEWMREAGLAVEVDPAGNLIGRAADPGVWTGSHLDSVPDGGKFDGALGVVAAIEAVERVGSGAAVVFRDEERGCVGSTQLAKWGPLPECFLEVHVEQGPVLERAGAPLGLARGVVGTPFTLRHDAGRAAARAAAGLRELVEGIDPEAVANIGVMQFDPGGVNVIPGRVRVSVDVRAPDRERLDRLVAALEVEPDFRLEPVPMADRPVAALRAEVAERGLPVIELPSGAGHDAAVLAAAGVPTGMLFVRSLNGGVSHSPEEESSPEDVALAVEVLAGALARVT